VVKIYKKSRMAANPKDRELGIEDWGLEYSGWGIVEKINN